MISHPSPTFWTHLDQLLQSSDIVIDRPKGSRHPRTPAIISPFDYGYLAGTNAGDGDGVDVWIGSMVGREITGVVCTVDLQKRDAEVKILLGCSEAEIEITEAFLNVGGMGCIVVRRW